MTNPMLAPLFPHIVLKSPYDLSDSQSLVHNIDKV